MLIWDLKFRGPECAICDLKFAVGEIIWGLIFLVLSLSKPFLSIKFVFETGQLVNWGL